MAKKSGAKKKKYEEGQKSLSFFEGKEKKVEEKTEEKKVVDIPVIVETKPKKEEPKKEEPKKEEPKKEEPKKEEPKKEEPKKEEPKKEEPKKEEPKKEEPKKEEPKKIINGIKCNWCGVMAERKNTRYWYTGALVCIPCWNDADQKHKKMMEELREEMGLGKLGDTAGWG